VCCHGGKCGLRCDAWANVVATGGGAIDLTGLGLAQITGNSSKMLPNDAFLLTGPTSPPATIDVYGSVTGPSNFGPGSNVTLASSGIGDLVGVNISTGFLARDVLVVPHSYTSGAVLTDSSTYDNATFASLGVTPGTYVWTWGAGADQRFTLKVGGVPGPTIGAGLPGLIAACCTLLFMFVRHRRRQHA
jgi:hypothetical protein